MSLTAGKGDMRRGEVQAVSVEGERRVAPWLSGWERLRVTISRMRAGRPAVLGESWAGSCSLRPFSWPALRTLLSKVWGEGRGREALKGTWDPGLPGLGGRGTMSASQDVGAQGTLRKSPKQRETWELEWQTAPWEGTLCAPCPGEGGPTEGQRSEPNRMAYSQIPLGQHSVGGASPAPTLHG